MSEAGSIIDAVYAKAMDKFKADAAPAMPDGYGIFCAIETSMRRFADECKDAIATQDAKRRKVEPSVDRYVRVVCVHCEGIFEKNLDRSLWRLPATMPADFPVRLRDLYAIDDTHMTLGAEQDESKEDNHEHNEKLVTSLEWITFTLTRFCGQPLKNGEVVHGTIRVLCVHDNWLAAE